MRKNLTDITVLLDRSGSMSSCVADTIGGFNTFVEEQKKVEGEATISAIQFDDQYDVLFPPGALNTVKLTKDNYQPRGSTALYDAICRSIDETGKRLADTPDESRPEMVIFVVITDGYENSSKKHDIQAVNDRISTQRDKYQWQFVFLAANQDAIAQAANMGMNPGFAMSYGQTPQGTHAAYVAAASNVRNTRASVAQGMAVNSAAGQSLSFTGDQKDAQDKEIEKAGGIKNKRRKAH